MNSTSVEASIEERAQQGLSIGRLVSRFLVLAVGTTCVWVNFTLLWINPNKPGAPIGLALGMLSMLLSPQGRAALARALRQMADGLSD